MDLHFHECYECVLTISIIYMSVYVCDKKFAARGTRKIMHKFSQNFIFSNNLTKNLGPCTFRANSSTGNHVVLRFSDCFG